VVILIIEKQIQEQYLKLGQETGYRDDFNGFTQSL
jgi:hypothetical protein